MCSITWECGAFSAVAAMMLKQVHLSRGTERGRDVLIITSFLPGPFHPATLAAGSVQGQKMFVGMASFRAADSLVHTGVKGLCAFTKGPLHLLVWCVRQLASSGILLAA
jgi:hypothetical protein